MFVIFAVVILLHFVCPYIEHPLQYCSFETLWAQTWAS